MLSVYLRTVELEDMFCNVADDDILVAGVHVLGLFLHSLIELWMTIVKEAWKANYSTHHFEVDFSRLGVNEQTSNEPPDIAVAGWGVDIHVDGVPDVVDGINGHTGGWVAQTYKQ